MSTKKAHLKSDTASQRLDQGTLKEILSFGADHPHTEDDLTYRLKKIVKDVDQLSQRVDRLLAHAD